MPLFDPRLQFIQMTASAPPPEPYTMLYSVLNRRFGYQTREQRPEVRVLLEYEGSLEATIASGFRPSSTAGRIVTGTISVDHLPALEQSEGVVYVESSRPLAHELDVSVPEVGANKVWAYSPANRGQDVIVGIVDSGIDYQHPSFRDKSGATRILKIWDQKLTPGFGESSPAAFTYGVEYTTRQIDAALRGGTSIRHVDSDGHGTHVAGIAAGNGLSSSTYVGVAPDADIMVVAAHLDTNLGDSFNTLDAINYLLAQAKQLCRPIVINLSQGDNLGPHDGTSMLERGIDSVMGSSGRAIVKSAGNCGSHSAHARFSVAPLGVHNLLFEVPAGDTTPDAFDIWYTGKARLQVRLMTPAGLKSSAIPAPRATPGLMPLPNGNAAFIASNVTNTFNGDNQIYIQLMPGTFPTIQAGVWAMELSERAGLSTDADAWIEAGDPNPIFLGSEVTRKGTITVPGTSKKIITVGAYTTKFSSGVGAMPDFSSWGPCRAGTVRPDLTAPGQEVESANLTGSGGSTYIKLEGTSIAAPHVTGAIALMFAEDASLTQSRIRDHLKATARTDSFTTSGDGWGAGKLDIDAACKAVQAAKTI